MKFMCFSSTLSYPHAEFLNLHSPHTRTKYNLHPPRSKFNSHPPCKCGYPQPVQVNPLCRTLHPIESGLNKLISKATSLDTLFDWQCMTCFPFSVVSLVFQPQCCIALSCHRESRTDDPPHNSNNRVFPTRLGRL